MTYSQKLKDPRWQKKRLEILQRDSFSCQNCGETTKTLHVHHRVYNGCDPWSINNECLLSLCEDCHKIFEIVTPEAIKNINSILKKRFYPNQIMLFAHLLESLQAKPDDIVEVLCHVLHNQDVFNKNLIERKRIVELINGEE